MSDSSTEMFVFITPKILSDPIQDLEKAKLEMWKTRPGDLPEFIEALVQAKKQAKRQLFEGSLKMLFGRSEEELAVFDFDASQEYDGR